jgi:metal-responsive CopG/Arc/MetJ family transcriptional regulator
MPSVKTAFSIQESLFKKADALARRLNISRSQLFSLAVEQFIRQHENRQLFEQINIAYDDVPDMEERERLLRLKTKQRRLVEGEW